MGIFIWSYVDPICMCTPCLRMVQNSKTQQVTQDSCSCRLSLFCNTLLPTICKAFHAQNTEGFGSATFKASFECGQIELGTPFHCYFHLRCKVFFFCWLQHRFCDRILPRFCCRNTIAVGATFRLPDLFSTNQPLTCHRRQRQSFGHPTTEFRSCFVHGEALLQVPWCKGAGLLYKG